MTRSADGCLKRHFAGYLFDLDGTLIDTAPDIGRALNAALAAAGLEPVDVSLTRHWVGHGSRVLLEQALTFHDLAERIEDENAMQGMLDDFIAYYRAHIADHSVPYPGTVDALEALRARGARLGVVTNKFEGLSRQVLGALQLDSYFEVLVGGDTLPVRKPDAGPALHACATLGVAVAETLFVGDSHTDVACARAAGCAVACVRDGYNHGTPAEALGADAVIDSLLELV